MRRSGQGTVHLALCPKLPRELTLTRRLAMTQSVKSGPSGGHCGMAAKWHFQISKRRWEPQPLIRVSILPRQAFTSYFSPLNKLKRERATFSTDSTANGSSL